jgi:carboxylesterase type B
VSSIRFAAPPLGALRFQAPQVPAENRSQVIQANAFAPQCPQSSVAPGGKGTLSTEDCLFLNVYAPQNATNLPVLVWIHGGGYGLGNGQQDMQAIINTNNGSFIGVAIQYRLGAFGFLSSDEVDRFGSVNAGILDQTFALQWVQQYIAAFGGDPRSVTISGESAGGGSVMLQTMAYGGTLGTSLFRSGIAASPYLPMQYGYKDWVPSQSYYAFAGLANCMPNTAYGSSSRTIFECLVNQDTETLQYASFNVSASGTFGTWGFLPVTDGVFIQDVPSQQLLEKKVNGENLLVGNNANEGPLFVPQDIDTEADLLAWLELTFPLFSNDDISRILRYCKSQPSLPFYPSHEQTLTNHRPQFQCHRLRLSHRLCNNRPLRPNRHQRILSSHRPTTTRQQHLRRNHLRMPLLLDVRSLHGRLQTIFPLPILCASSSTRRRRQWILWPCSTYPRPLVRSSFHVHLGPIRRQHQSLHSC